MITAHQLEVRAGARLLMDGVSFRVGARRPGRPGRTQRRRQDHADPDPGRRGRCRRPARSPRPGPSATCRRTRAPATSTCSPATGSCPRAAWTRSYAGCGTPRTKMGSDDPDVAETGRCGATTAADADAARRRWLRRRVRGRADRGQPRHRGPAARPAAAAPCPAASGAGSSWPGSCSPVRRRCCSTSPPTTSTPTRSCGCASSCARTRAVWS